MWRRAALLLCPCLLAGGLAGCGSAARHSTHTTSVTTARRSRTQTTDANLNTFRVGVIGPASGSASGVTLVRTSPANASRYRFVLVAASALEPSALSELAAEDPSTTFAVLDAPRSRHLRRNVTGIVLRADEAARLGGVVSGLVAAGTSATDARVAWVGPQDAKLVSAYVLGVHDVAPGVSILRAAASTTPADCKEAALGAILRNAQVVMAAGGACAAAAAAGAHDQNVPALELSDFELPEAAASQMLHDASLGVFHGGEDVLYGAASGAIGIRSLDPRIPLDVEARAETAASGLASSVSPAG